MTKADLIAKVASRGDGMSKKGVEKIVDNVFATMTQAISKEGRFAYPGFGTFTVKKRAARMGRNPQTGQSIKIPASKSVGFKAAPAFKHKL